MSTKKVQNPNQKGGAGFLWAIIAVIAIAAIVIGFIVFNGRSERAAAVAENKVDVEGLAMSYDQPTGVVSLRPEGDTQATPDAELYEDFSCTFCADLAMETDERMLDEIAAGNLAVDIRPLNFLDRGAEGNSTKVLAATLATANSGDPELYWNFRAAMFENQQDIYNKWSNDDFANLAEQLGAESETVDAIRNGDYMDEATAIGQQNADRLNEQTGSVSSPRVIIDGQDVEQVNQWIDVALDQA